MTRHRLARLSEQLKREISEILARRVRDPRIGSILVTHARVTPDLWLARVFVRPVHAEEDVDEMLEGLEAAAPFIRRELAKALHIHRVPELRFLHDTTLDSAMRIEEVLREVLPEGADDHQEDLGEGEAREAEGGPAVLDAESSGGRGGSNDLGVEGLQDEPREGAE